MASLTDRQQQILFHIVHDYITSATPVASEVLVQRYSLPVSPATIRNEMTELADLGYLAKQHVSSGRVPTTQAYRFFVDRVSANRQKLSPAYAKRVVEALYEAQMEDYRAAVRNMVETLSSLSHALTIGYSPDQEMIYRDGMEYFLEEPEFSTRQALHDATLFTEELHDIFFSEFQNHANEIEGLKIFIGNESPFKIEDRENYSLMIAPMRVGKEKQTAFFTLVGPLRMAYDNNMSLLDYILHNQE